MFFQVNRQQLVRHGSEQRFAEHLPLSGVRGGGGEWKNLYCEAGQTLMSVYYLYFNA
jgi:hypothetical protein